MLPALGVLPLSLSSAFVCLGIRRIRCSCWFGSRVTAHGQVISNLARIRKQSRFRSGQEVQCCPTGGPGDTQVTTSCVSLAGFAPSLESQGQTEMRGRCFLAHSAQRQQWPEWAPVPPSRRHPGGKLLSCPWGTQVVAPGASLVPGGEPVPSAGRAVTPAELCPPPLLPLFIPPFAAGASSCHPWGHTGCVLQASPGGHSDVGAAVSSAWTMVGRKAEMAPDVNECRKI